jgi:hypothetical protein
MGLFVPGSVITPIEQDSFPCSIAARSAAQKSSSCTRMRAIAYNKSSSAKQAAFDLNIALSLEHLAFAIVIGGLDTLKK